MRWAWKCALLAWSSSLLSSTSCVEAPPERCPDSERTPCAQYGSPPSYDAQNYPCAPNEWLASCEAYYTQPGVSGPSEPACVSEAHLRDVCVSVNCYLRGEILVLSCGEPEPLDP